MLLQWQMAILGTFIPELKTDNIRKVIGESLYFSVCPFEVLPYFEIRPYSCIGSYSNKRNSDNLKGQAKANPLAFFYGAVALFLVNHKLKTDRRGDQLSCDQGSR